MHRYLLIGTVVTCKAQSLCSTVCLKKRALINRNVCFKMTVLLEHQIYHSNVTYFKGNKISFRLVSNKTYQVHKMFGTRSQNKKWFFCMSCFRDFFYMFFFRNSLVQIYKNTQKIRLSANLLVCPSVQPSAQLYSSKTGCITKKLQFSRRYKTPYNTNFI